MPKLVEPESMPKLVEPESMPQTKAPAIAEPQVLQTRDGTDRQDEIFTEPQAQAQPWLYQMVCRL